MRRTVSFILLVAFLVGACSTAQGPAEQSQGATSAAASAPAATKVDLTGAGATFPFPLYSRWFDEYSKVHPDVRFNYQSIGSGGGIKQVTANTVDFGASDAILSASDKKNAPGLLMFPTVAGGVVVAYNVKDADGQAIGTGLHLNPAVLADIFLGKITQWNDPAIAEINPQVKLPATDIVVAYRSDGSGTSFIFTNYLAQVSQEWADTVGAGKSVQWPVGLGGKGNEGVAGVITQQPNSIGYIELAYAEQNTIPFAAIENKAGNFVLPSLDSITAASNGAAASIPEDMGQLLVNAAGEDSYAIAGYTFLLLYQDMRSCVKARTLVDFTRWAYDNGDAFARELLYAPLGDSVKQMALARLDTLTCEGGKPIQ